MKSIKITICAIIIATSGVFAQKKIVRKAAYSDVSEPLVTLKANPNDAYKKWEEGVVKNKFKYQNINVPENITDPVRQDFQGAKQSAETLVTIEGVNNISGVAPPDTDGDVGIGYYVQMVNSQIKIFDKVGNSIYGPEPNSIIWDGFVGPWTGTNDGDPVVVYDEIADRWLVSQFAVNTNDGSQWELIAVSVSGNPTGSYYRYAFEFDDMPDYPHFGIWPDAYYMSINRFPANGSNGFGPGAVAFERDQMLIGNPNARMVLFELSPNQAWSQLPADCDGAFPPLGTPNYFVSFTDDNFGHPDDALKIFEFHVDWNNPNNSTFTHSLTLSVDDFVAGFNDGIRQPNDQRLSTLADRLMFRVQYRKFAAYEAMVLNHSVNVGANQAGVRWYQLRRTSADWEVYQQGTYAPDTDSRWMASIAMNGNGDIALGYSVSSETVFPSIRYTGRLEGDPLGEMTIAEQSILEGVNAQNGTDRWGDYCMMSVDPSDDATFWFTTEYTDGAWNWRTKIAGFMLEDLGNPTNLFTETLSDTEIEVFWDLNNNNDDVFVAISAVNDFGIPNGGTIYNVGDEIAGGGTVIYNGSQTSVLSDNLQPQTPYFYKIWSQDGSDAYTPGILTSGETFCGPIMAFPYTESFEEDEFGECWNTDYESDLKWHVVTADNTSEPSSAADGENYIHIFDMTTDADTALLITPPLDLTSLSNPHLFFSHFMKERTFFEYIFQDELKVHYRNGFDGEWVQIAHYVDNVEQWTDRLIELPEVSDKYFVAFEGVAKMGLGVCIDDMRIGEQSVLTESFIKEEGMEIFPNPTKNGIVNLKLDNVEAGEMLYVKVSDIAGKKIFEKFIAKADLNQIELKNLNKGVYLLEVSYNNQQVYTKIVLE